MRRPFTRRLVFDHLLAVWTRGAPDADADPMGTREDRPPPFRDAPSRRSL